MQKEPENWKWSGLTDDEVIRSREKHGENFIAKSKKEFFIILKGVVSEPMFLLLVATCSIYFIVGEYSEGFIMLLAMLFVASISFFQERRNMKALEEVRKMSQPKAKVIRNYKLIEIYSKEIVVGDILLVEEGEQITADGSIVEAHDFSVDESLLTGESLAVDKNETSENNEVYLGSNVRTGSVIVRVSEVGVQTMLGKLGKTIEEIKPTQSRFQKEIRTFIKRLAIAGVAAFVLVLGINYFKTNDLVSSILYALALAMSLLPEEIPVAFSTFMALGSWRLLKEEVLVKDPNVIETLGSSTMICIDKTGTITENKMILSRIFSFEDRELFTIDNCNASAKEVVSFAMWSSEPTPFDPMEIAIHDAYKKINKNDDRGNFNLIHEYPLAGQPPAMTHIYENKEGDRIIACKGGAESIIQFSKLSSSDSTYVLDKVKELAAMGFRVLGVASAKFDKSNFPNEQKDFNWSFKGLVGLYDPPKENIKDVLQNFYKANIQVKIISGDYALTTQSIAKEIGFEGSDKIITGKEISELDDEKLKSIVLEKNIFARMFPDAKLWVVKALKENGEIVAMTGDGVNDGPALKAADIGVSMGSQGTEIAKGASSIVLLGNDISKMFLSIILGRKIYLNLKKAIRYILSIHIAIITTVTGPLILGWEIINIFMPIHIIFFELIMGPTCSIIYENEPAEKGIERSKPRSGSTGFLSFDELLISIIQGAVISLGILTLYYLCMRNGYEKDLVRSMVFMTIAISNIFLTIVNRSFEKSLFKTIFYKNNLILLIISLTILLLFVIFYLSPVRSLFMLVPISITQLAICIGVAFLSVGWIEIYKFIKK